MYITTVLARLSSLFSRSYERRLRRWRETRKPTNWPQAAEHAQVIRFRLTRSTVAVRKCAQQAVWHVGRPASRNGPMVCPSLVGQPARCVAGYPVGVESVSGGHSAGSWEREAGSLRVRNTSFWGFLILMTRRLAYVFAGTLCFGGCLGG